MLGRKETKETGKSKSVIRYRFNLNDPVLCTIKNCGIDNAIVLNRNIIGVEVFYKIGDKQEINTRVCKERELLHR